MAVAKFASRQRGERLEVRTTLENKTLWQKAAELEGRTLSDFIVSSALEAAKRSIRETDLLNLSLQDRRAFVSALLEPASEPNARLSAAALRHQQELG